MKTMKVKDKTIKKLVDVSQKECPRFTCYWPRPDPGVFTQGVGYTKSVNGDRGYLCGNREIKGCPDNPILNSD
jgi:hypothetical protein